MTHKFNPTPHVNGQYGAPMGRPSTNPNPTYTGKLYLKQVPLHDGYDKGGAYWGYPNDIYWVGNGIDFPDDIQFKCASCGDISNYQHDYCLNQIWHVKNPAPKSDLYHYCKGEVYPTITYVDAFFRANNREEAKAKALKDYPNAKFYK